MKKYILGLISILGLGIINFSSAYTITRDSYVELTSSNNRTTSVNSGYCVYLNFSSRSFNVVDGNNTLTLTNPMNTFYCFEYGGTITTTSTSSTTINIYDFNDYLSSNSSCDYSDYTLTSDITKSYCTNRYSDLIDESDITSGYCETEFGLIDPENCPSSGGSGDVNWSSFFVNSHQVEGASNIYLFLPDFLNWDYTYLNSGATLEINVENEGDEDYINGLLAVETFHPSSEDFTQSFTGTLTLLMPYIIITLFIIFLRKLIKRIFK